MSYLVYCTFDLKNASSQDYEVAYGALKKIGLEKVITSDNGGDIVVPTTSAIGTFNGDGASAIQDDIRKRVKAAFTALRLKSEIFIVVGGNWACGATKT